MAVSEGQKKSISARKAPFSSMSSLKLGARDGSGLSVGPSDVEMLYSAQQQKGLRWCTLGQSTTRKTKHLTAVAEGRTIAQGSCRIRQSSSRRSSPHSSIDRRGISRFIRKPCSRSCIYMPLFPMMCILCHLSRIASSKSTGTRFESA